jgi:N-acetylmuramoyl-L-alanine amidase
VKKPTEAIETKPNTNEVVAIPSTENKSEEKNSKIVFKVQLMASGKDLPLVPSNFKGLRTISKEPYKNLYRYLYGETRSYREAKMLQSNASSSGYTTSYIVAYKEGIRIPIAEALKEVSE